jgi:pSer/pThr/pTyr-binding forkhead associated (FHA) protein
MSWPKLDLFRQACGANGPLELEWACAGQNVPQARAFEQPFVLLGRKTDNDICLRSDDISRRHAYFQVIAGRLFVMDLGSREGVVFANRRLSGGWLGPGQVLRVGPATVRLCLPCGADGRPAATDDCPLTSLPDGRSLVPSVRLEITGQGKKARARMNRAVTLVGTDAACKIRFAGPGVSHFHCSLVHTPLGVWVVDLLSRTGTVLNGERVRWAQLADGDCLQVGAYLIRLRYQAEKIAGAPARGEVLETQQAVCRPDDLAGGPPVSAGPLVLARPSDALLLPVIDKFNLMQQQMFDQFHQTLVLVVQMFGSLHRDQMATVREELDQIWQLTRELQDLQGQLLSHTPGSVGDAASPRPERPEVQLPGEPTGLPAGPEAASSQPAADASIHGWLGRRILALNAERQGRWQKLMDFVMGK